MFCKKPKLGLIAPDYKDERDFQLASIQPQKVSVPDEFDLRDKMGQVGLQHWGSCSSWGSTALAEYWNKQEYHKDINLSEKFVYHNIKKISGLWDNEGDYGRNGLKALCQFGAPLLEDYPNDREKNWQEYAQKEPSQEVYNKALEYKGKSYWRVGRTLDDFLQAQFQNQCPVMFGMAWYQSYYGIKSDGKLPLPFGKRYGGHLVSTAGWEREKLWVKNSHGENWGNNGYFYIPFSEFSKQDIWDAWVLTDAEPEQPIEGWVALQYLQRLLQVGDLVSPTTSLNIRETPGGNKIKTLSIKDIGEITENIVKQGNYDWIKLRVKE